MAVRYHITFESRIICGEIEGFGFLDIQTDDGNGICGEFDEMFPNSLATKVDDKFTIVTNVPKKFIDDYDSIGLKWDTVKEFEEFDKAVDYLESLDKITFKEAEKKGWFGEDNDLNTPKLETKGNWDYVENKRREKAESKLKDESLILIKELAKQKITEEEYYVKKLASYVKCYGREEGEQKFKDWYRSVYKSKKDTSGCMLTILLFITFITLLSFNSFSQTYNDIMSIELRPFEFF